MQAEYIDFSQTQETASFRAILVHYCIEVQAASGDEVKINCPFHEDSHPSCFVNTTKKLFNCFACGAGGNLLEFVRSMEQMGNGADGLRDAARVLASMNGQGAGTSGGWSARSGRTQSKRQKIAEKKKEPVSNKVLTFRLTTTQDHPFFQSHGITAQMIDTFGLGYADTGIMAGRIVIPIHNAKGQLVAYAGRHAEEDVPAGVPRYKLPKTFQKSVELYNLNRALEIGRSHVVIVEGFWSAMRLHLAGIPVVAVMGTTISAAQVDLLRNAGCQSATVLFDGDAAGRTGAVAVAGKLAAHMDVQRLDLPEGIKPDVMDAGWLKHISVQMNPLPLPLACARTR